jgi:hypothetical protein
MPEIAELFRAALDDQPPLSISRDSAIAAGRRARRRRSAVVGSTCAFVAVALAVTATVLGRGVSDAPGLAPPSTLARTRYQVPQLPLAVGEPGAAQRPDLVGSDPLLRHFGLDFSTWPVGAAVYSSQEGTESIFAGGVSVTVSRVKEKAAKEIDLTGVALLPAPTTLEPSPSPHKPTITTNQIVFEGHPATLVSATFGSGRFPHWALLWQPVDRLWVGLHVSTETGEDELWQEVAALRLDRAHRCVVPFRLTELPIGTHLISCTAGLPVAGDPYAYSEVQIGDGHGNDVDVMVGQIFRSAHPDGDGQHSLASLPPANRTVNGRPVYWDGQAYLADDWFGTPIRISAHGTYGEAEATRVLDGMRVAPSLTDPSTWPVIPIG